MAGGEGKKGSVPLTVSALAEHPLLRENRVTRNRIEEIEQMKIDPRPLELDALARALELPLDWFDITQPVGAAGVPPIRGETGRRLGGHPPTAEDPREHGSRQEPESPTGTDG